MKKKYLEEHAKDGSRLYMVMPNQNVDFLLSGVKVILKEIMTTVSGQFIIFNGANKQYYIDSDRVVDYYKKIKQKAMLLAEATD